MGRTVDHPKGPNMSQLIKVLVPVISKFYHQIPRKPSTNPHQIQKICIPLEMPSFFGYQTTKPPSSKFQKNKNIATPSHKDLPEATESTVFTGSEALGHGTRPAVPVVPVAHHTDEDRARGPGRKTETKDSAWCGKKPSKKSSEHPQTRRLSSLELGYLRKCSYGYYRDFIPTYGGLQIYNHGYPFVTSGAPPNRKQWVTLMGKVEMFLKSAMCFLLGNKNSIDLLAESDMVS